MKKFLVENVVLGISPRDPFSPFSVGGYKFRYCGHPKTGSIVVFSSKNVLEDARKNHQNTEIEFDGGEKLTVIFTEGGVVGRRGEGPENSEEITFLEDILVIGSILTGWNWQLATWKEYENYWPYGKNALKCVCSNSEQCEKYLQQSICKLLDPAWQLQFENGYHLRMLNNHGKIPIKEPRFLANFVIWEWLFPHIKNPNGAGVQDESENLREIFSDILLHYWGDQVNTDIFNDREVNIFQILRNQLTHSSKLPVNRRGALDWMKKLTLDDVNRYLEFFDVLTQAVVLKTLNIDAEKKLFRWQPCEIQYFLEHGKLSLSEIT